MASEEGQSPISSHWSFDVIKTQFVWVMSRLNCGSFSSHQCRSFRLFLNTTDKKLNMTVESSSLVIAIFLFVYFNVLEILESSEIQNLNIESLDLLLQQISLHSYIFIFLPDREKTIASAHMAVVHLIKLLKSHLVFLEVFEIGLCLKTFDTGLIS